MGWGTFISATAMKRAYKYTEPGSPVRAFCLQGEIIFPPSSCPYLDKPPHKFLADWARNSLRREEKGSDNYVVEHCMVPGCEWHEHETELEKEQCVTRVWMNRGMEEY
jgi:hypothetical protein